MEYRHSDLSGNPADCKIRIRAKRYLRRQGFYISPFIPNKELVGTVKSMRKLQKIKERQV